MKYFFLLGLISICSLGAYANICSEDEYVVSEHVREAYYRGDGTYVSKANVSSYCKKYSSNQATQIVFPKDKIRNWPFPNEKLKKCSKLQKKAIQGPLNKNPALLGNLGTVSIYCANQSSTKDNPATSLPRKNQIVLYDLAFKGNINAIVFHELAHIRYDQFSLKEKRSYWSSSGWREESTDGKLTTDRIYFSATDGVISLDEDFANNVESYLTENIKFKTNFPEIHKWLMEKEGERK